MLVLAMEFSKGARRGRTLKTEQRRPTRPVPVQEVETYDRMGSRMAE
jgi:hypothetical protein